MCNDHLHWSVYIIFVSPQVWPKDALEAVAYKFLKEMDLDDPTRVKLVELCQSVHRKVRRLDMAGTVHL